MTSAQVDTYLERFDGITRERLDEVRRVLHEALPDAAETIAYGVPTLTLAGKNVVHFGGYAAHVGVYPVPADTAFEAAAEAYRAGKGTLRFRHDRPLPLDLIAEQARLLAKRR